MFLSYTCLFSFMFHHLHEALIFCPSLCVHGYENNGNWFDSEERVVMFQACLMNHFIPYFLFEWVFWTLASIITSLQAVFDPLCSLSISGIPTKPMSSWSGFLGEENTSFEIRTCGWMSSSKLQGVPFLSSQLTKVHREADFLGLRKYGCLPRHRVLQYFVFF